MGFVIATVSKLRDPLYRNALYLILTSASGGLFGFLFWLVVARLYPAEEIGLAASLVALAGFLGSLSTLGLGFGLVRQLPSAPRSHHLINASLTLTSLVAIGVALVFIASVDLWSASDLGSRQSALAFLFLAYTVAFAVTLLIDASLMAARGASSVFRRSLIYNGIRLPLPVLLAGSLGAIGIHLSFAVALYASILVSLFLMLPRLFPGYSPALSLRLASIRKLLAYSLGNHVANIAYALPAGALPLLVLGLLSPTSAAHFYVVWIIATMLFVVPLASASSLFIEGSHPETELYGNVVRSLRFSLILLAPGVAFLVLGGPVFLGLFGSEYAAEGTGLLRVLALSAGFVAVNVTFFSYLRVAGRIKELILLSSLLGGGTVLTSYLSLPGLGLIGIGLPFLVLQASVAGYVSIRNWGTSRRFVKEIIRF